MEGGEERRGRRRSTAIGIPFQHSLEPPKSDEWCEFYKKGKSGTGSDDAEDVWISNYINLCKQSPIMTTAVGSQSQEDDVGNVLRDWNDEYQHILSSRCSYSEKETLLQNFVDAFKEEIEPIVETIAQELFWEEKTLTAEGGIQEASNGFPVGFYSCANLIFHLSSEPSLPSRVARNSAAVASVLLYDNNSNSSFTTPFCNYFTYGTKRILVAAKIRLSDDSNVITNTPRGTYCLRKISVSLGREVCEHQFIHSEGGFFYFIPQSKLFKDDCPLVLAARNPFSEKTKEELLKKTFSDVETSLLSCKAPELPFVINELNNNGIPLNCIGLLINSSEVLQSTDSKIRSLLIAVVVARCVRQVAVSEVLSRSDELGRQNVEDDALLAYCNRYFHTALTEDEEVFSSLITPLTTEILNFSPPPIPRGIHKSFIRYLGDLLGLATVSHKVVSTAPVLLKSVATHLIRPQLLDLVRSVDVKTCSIPPTLLLLHQVQAENTSKSEIEEMLSEEEELYTLSVCYEIIARSSEKTDLKAYQLAVSTRREAVSTTPKDELEQVRITSRMAMFNYNLESIKQLQESASQLEIIFQKERSLKSELLTLLTQLIRLLQHFDNIAKAESYADQLVALIDNSKTSDCEVVPSLALQASVFVNNNKFEAAADVISRGLCLCEGSSTPEITLALAEFNYLNHFMAIESFSLSSQRDYVTAVEAFEKLTDASTPSSPIKVSALRYLGHLRMHESPEIGNNYFKMAVELSSQLYPSCHFERHLAEQDLKSCLRREGVIILQSYCRSAVSLLKVETLRKKKTSSGNVKVKSKTKPKKKEDEITSSTWADMNSPQRGRQSPSFSPPMTRSPFANSLGEEEPIPIQPPRSSTPMPTQTQLAPLGAPRTAASYSYLSSRSKLLLPGIKSSKSLSALRGSRSLVVQKCQKAAEYDYRWWSNKTRLLQAKLGSIQRSGERQSANDAKQQFVFKQQADLSTQLDLKSKLAIIELSQKKETVRSAREDQRTAIKDARQQLFGHKSQLRYRGLKESEKNKITIEKTSLKNRKEKIEAANQIKLQRLVASNDKTTRTLKGESSAQHYFEEKIQNRLQAQRNYEDETISLVQASSSLLKQLRILHIKQTDASATIQ